MEEKLLPVALSELNASDPFCPIPKYVTTVKAGADNENINKCLLILVLQQQQQQN